MLDESIYKHRVRELCPAAVSKFDIVSAALFQKSHAGNGASIARLEIEFSHTLMSIEKTWASEFWLPTMARYKFVLPQDNSDSCAQTSFKPIFAGKILVDSDPKTVKAAWHFNVDMKNGTVNASD
jgi:hypothetical protein